MTEKGLEEGKQLCRWGERTMETSRCNCCSACLFLPPNLSPACATLSFLNLHYDRRTLNEQAFREFPFIPHMNSKPWSVFFHLPEKKAFYYLTKTTHTPKFWWLKPIQSWSLKQMMTFRITLGIIRNSKKERMCAWYWWFHVFSVGRHISATSLSAVIGPQSWIG